MPAHDTRTHAALAWQTHATCAQIGGEAWFPDTNDPASAARDVCAACPVRGPCLAYAINEHIEHGIWGGRTPTERAQLLADRHPPTTKDQR